MLVQVDAIDDWVMSRLFGVYEGSMSDPVPDFGGEHEMYAAYGGMRPVQARTPLRGHELLKRVRLTR